MDIVMKQLAIDYCCKAEDVNDRNNHFSVYDLKEGRRRFRGDEECFLKIAAVNGKLLFTGRSDIIHLCKEKYGNASGEWFMEAKTLLELEKILFEYGHQIEQVHPFFVASKKTENEDLRFETLWYHREDIMKFKEDARFDEAFAFCEDAPDEIGVAAYNGKEIIGMAGASSDSPTMWQIGINVVPLEQSRGVGTTLVALIKNAVLDLGAIPYYGTAMSHIASQRVAIKAGFLPEWAELVTSRISK